MCELNLPVNVTRIFESGRAADHINMWTSDQHRLAILWRWHISG